MPTSKVGIINTAAGLIGSDGIAALPSDADLNSQQVAKFARWALRLYDQQYEATLSLWPWNDARRRYQLPAHGTPPAFGHSAQYELDPAILKVVGVRNYGNPWEREGRFILHSGGATINVITIDLVPEEQLNAVTANLVSARLAQACAIAMAESAAKQARCVEAAKTALNEALNADNWEGSSEQLLQSGWALAAYTSYPIERLGWGDGSAGWLEAAGITS